jgi:hypothetical protein
MREQSLRAIAEMLGGVVSGAQVLAPGPGHSPKDRSMCVKLSTSPPNGFIAHSFAGDDWRTCREHVASRLGLSSSRCHAWINRCDRSHTAAPRDDGGKLLWIWRQRRPISGTPAEHYLRKVRGYQCKIPATLGYLPPRGVHPPAMIAAFGKASELEPSVLAIDDGAVRAIHLTKLRSDGSGKTDAKPDKIIVGQAALAVPIVLAAPNDLLGLAITEGIEDGLSIHAATGLGVWAASTAGRMPALAEAVPAYVECVTVIGHRDQAGERGATGLVSRLKARGFEVLLTFLSEAAA